MLDVTIYVLCKWMIEESFPLEGLSFGDWIYYNTEEGDKPFVWIEVYTVLSDKDDMLTITGTTIKNMDKKELDTHRESTMKMAMN